MWGFGLGSILGAKKVAEDMQKESYTSESVKTATEEIRRKNSEAIARALSEGVEAEEYVSPTPPYILPPEEPAIGPKGERGPKGPRGVGAIGTIGEDGALAQTFMGVSSKSIKRLKELSSTYDVPIETMLDILDESLSDIPRTMLKEMNKDAKYHD